jgi:exodeoxyribonuclease VII small subunit
MASKAPKTSKAKSTQPPTASYAELQTELDALLTELQRDELDVDEALRYYERGLELVQQLEAYLRNAENKITELQARTPHSL